MYLKVRITNSIKTLAYILSRNARYDLYREKGVTPNAVIYHTLIENLFTQGSIHLMIYVLENLKFVVL